MTKTYFDGALTSTASQNFAIPSDGSASLVVGWNGFSPSLGNQTYNVSLAELRVYSRALSPNEVLALAQPPLASVANAFPSPAVPTLGAISYLFSCAAGTAGAPGTLARSLVDNSWSWLAGVAPNCTTCPAGSFAQPGSTTCAPCYPGTYSLAGASSCTLCPAGTFGSSAGMSSSACSGACAYCAAGSTQGPLAAPLSCAPSNARAISTSLGLKIWPASHPSNPLGVDLVAAPQPLCGQMSPGGVCNTTSANTILGADGTTRYAVGTAAQLNMGAADAMTCSAS